jgi:hypothetical protein
MSRFSSIILFLVLAIVLSACGTSAPAATTTDSYTSPNLDISYTNALPARMQLSLGTIKLAETNTPITTDQAAKFLPLWQALLSMTTSGNSATAEVNALLAQIETIFSPEQLSAIKGMKMTFADMTSWAAANGVTLGSGSGQPGQGQGMSAEAKATRQAENGKTGSSSPSTGASAALTRATIQYLETIK